MGIPGIAFRPDNDQLLQSIKRHRGVVTHIAKEYDVWVDTIYDYVKKHPILDQALKNARKTMVSKMVDQAESVMENLMDTVEDDRNNAFKAAAFMLNNQAKDRGYAHPKLDPRFEADFTSIDTAIVDAHEALNGNAE